MLHGRSVLERGVIRNSFGPNEVAWINGGDAAELALTALLRPERFAEPIYYAKGAEVLSHTEIAALITELSSVDVRYEAVTQEEWRRDLEAQSQYAGENVVNPAMAQHISAVGDMVARSGRTLPADADALRDLIGREPVTVRDYLQANLAGFAAHQPV